MGLGELRHISLKWKLLIPFLFLPAALTVLLVTWGFFTQRRILSEEEEGRLRADYRHFFQRINLRRDMALALAGTVASNPEVQKALAEQDRAELIRRYRRTYELLHRHLGLKQFHFHLYPATSFLRLHRPDLCGEEMASYRRTIMEAHETRKLTGGLEQGVTGFGVRGVAPVFYQGRDVGSVEFGWSVGRPFLDQLKKDLGCDLTLYVQEPEGASGLGVLAATSPEATNLAGSAYEEAFKSGRITFLTLDQGGRDLAVIIGPVWDFRGQRAAVVELARDRRSTLAEMRRYSVWILALGAAALGLSLLFVWRVSTLFLAPIGNLVDQAEKIAVGRRVPQMEIKVYDEFGILAEALNRMLAALEHSRRRIEEYARDLEARVQARTADLVQSEERYRTLVENIPLVVYQLEQDLVCTFISPYVEVLVGRPAEELVGGPAVWGEIIHPEDREAVLAEKRRCLARGEIFEMEFRLQDQEGTEIPVLDFAVPAAEESGPVLYLQGFLLDLREQKRLEEQTRRAEELKTLSDISARLAHEFRNPLTAVGVCARRLVKGLTENDPGARHARIIVEEVARLEKILHMIQAYIQQVSPRLQEIKARALLEDLARTARPFLEEHEVEFRLDLAEDLPPLKVDPGLMGRALENLIRNAAFQIPARGRLTLQAHPQGEALEIRLVYPAGYLADDQLRHFFYPFTTEEADTSLVELPLVPVIIHKHNGVISVEREGEDLVAVSISLPV